MQVSKYICASLEMQIQSSSNLDHNNELFYVQMCIRDSNYKVLNEVDMLQGADNMPGKWQFLIFLGQQTILKLSLIHISVILCPQTTST